MSLKEKEYEILRERIFGNKQDTEGIHTSQRIEASNIKTAHKLKEEISGFRKSIEMLKTEMERKISEMRTEMEEKVEDATKKHLNVSHI